MKRINPKAARMMDVMLGAQALRCVYARQSNLRIWQLPMEEAPPQNRSPVPAGMTRLRRTNGLE